MSLRTAVAAPFRMKGQSRLDESEYVVTLTLKRDWFTPNQAKRLVDVAVGEGLLQREENDLIAEFEPDSVSVPEDFTPDESILNERSTFEKVLDSLDGVDETKQESVAAINQLQSELGLTVEAAAILYAHRNGIDVSDVAERALSELRES